MIDNYGWFIREDVAHRMSAAVKSGKGPSVAECEQFRIVAEAQAAADERPSNLRISGRTAYIAIEGALTERPSLWAMLFGDGNATYRDIRQALALADKDESVGDIVLEINSPGGNVAGLFDTLDALQGTRKRVTARVAMACSAAYAIAAQASKIEAYGKAACVGSIGVAAAFYVDESVVWVTSSESPNKRPDVRTPEGQAVVRKELDDIHDLFVAEIARGRQSTAADVNKNYGRGSVVLAAEAMRLGMIDSIAGKGSRGGASASHDDSQRENAAADEDREETPIMSAVTLKQLKAQHPDIFDEHAEAVRKDTLTAERDRVNGHLVMGVDSGDMQTALEAVRSGEAMTVTLQSKYMMAAARRGAVETRSGDAAVVTDATSGAAVPADKQPSETGESPAADLGDRVVAALKARNGIG